MKKTSIPKKTDAFDSIIHIPSPVERWESGKDCLQSFLSKENQFNEDGFSLSKKGSFTLRVARSKLKLRKDDNTEIESFILNQIREKDKNSGMIIVLEKSKSFIFLESASNLYNLAHPQHSAKCRNLTITTEALEKMGAKIFNPTTSKGKKALNDYVATL